MDYSAFLGNNLDDFKTVLLEAGLSESQAIAVINTIKSRAFHNLQEKVLLQRKQTRDRVRKFRAKQ